MCYAQIAMAVIAVVGGVMQAKAAKAEGNANAQIAENNARLSEEQGKDEAILGARESQQAAWRTRALMGQQKAAAAASNLDSELGTPMELMEDASLFGGADQSAISMNAARKAWGFQAEALNYRNQGALAKWSGNTKAKITLLNSLGQAVGSFSGGMGGGMSGASSASSGGSSGGYVGTGPY